MYIFTFRFIQPLLLLLAALAIENDDIFLDNGLIVNIIKNRIHLTKKKKGTKTVKWEKSKERLS